MMESSEKNKLLRAAFIVFLASLFLEGIVFNFRFFESLGYKETTLESSYHSIGLTQYNETKYYSRKGYDAYIEYDGIDEKINNIYIDIKRENHNRITDKQKLDITIRATDEANENLFDLPQRHIIADVERSKYIKMNLSGKTDKLQIVFDNIADEEIYVEKISINKKLPYSFDFLRFLVVFSVILVCYLFRADSWVYGRNFSFRKQKQSLIILLLAALNSIVIITFVFSNPFFLQTRRAPHLQYYKLTRALTEGHFYLSDEASDELKEMDNPYDTNERMKLNVEYKWDYAYYNGKYYVYFGIVPVIIFYLPLYLLTGFMISNEYVIMMIAFMYMAATFLLVREIVKRWFENIPYAIYLLMSELMFLSSGAVFPIKRPDFYFIPVFFGITLAVFAIYFWISSIDQKTGKLSKGRLFLGSLCMALTAGTRPQLLIASFFAIPLFWDKVFKDRRLFSKKSVKETFLFVLPYIVTAAFLMYYNYARFGNIFDFGANYNLTTNDMTKRGFVPDRIPTGIFMYLFEPAVYTEEFPFIRAMEFKTSYMGMTIHELMFGGAFASHIVLLSVFSVFRLKKGLRRKKLFYFVLCAVLFAVAIAVTDTEIAGLLQRYTVDFSWLLFLAAIVCISEITVKLRRFKYFGDVCAITAFICGLSFLYDASAFFFLGDYSTADKNPVFFYSVMHSVAFWL